MSSYLYIGTNGYVAAIEPATGREIWRTPLRSGFLATTIQQDVAVVDDGPYVFAGCYGGLYCLDAQTGQMLWQNELKGMGFNDVSLSIGGKAVTCAKVEVSSSNP